MYRKVLYKGSCSLWFEQYACCDVQQCWLNFKTFYSTIFKAVKVKKMIHRNWGAMGKAYHGEKHSQLALSGDAFPLVCPIIKKAHRQTPPPALSWSIKKKERGKFLPREKDAIMFSQRGVSEKKRRKENPESWQKAPLHCSSSLPPWRLCWDLLTGAGWGPAGPGARVKANLPGVSLSTVPGLNIIWLSIVQREETRLCPWQPEIFPTQISFLSPQGGFWWTAGHALLFHWRARSVF